MRRDRTVTFDRCLRLMVPQTLNRALHDAAARNQLSMSEYLRQAARDRLRRDAKQQREETAA